MAVAPNSAENRRRKPPFANLYWFPLAALYAAIILPVSVAGQLGWFPVPAGLLYAWGHGHEMIFGFALAVIAGYISGPMPKRTVYGWLALWFAARVSFWFAPTSLLSVALNLLFVAVLVHKLAPIFLRTAKKWRNKSVGFILLGLLLAASVFHFYQYGSSATGAASQPAQRMLVEAVLLLSALMFFMGGRIIAPAMAGHFQRNNLFMKDRVQARFEGSILVLLFALLLLNLNPHLVSPWLASERLIAVLLVLCSLLGVIRMLRWRPWWCYDRADLLLMLVGYSWIKIGWLLMALSFWDPSFSLTQSLHAITVGALGTLTFTVMARSRAHRVLRDPNAKPWIFLLPLALSVAALLRLSASSWNYSLAMLLAVVLWSVSFIGLTLWLIWLRSQEKTR